MVSSKLCDVCICSEFLCPSCKDKLEAGNITDDDITLERELHKLAKTEPELSTANILKKMHMDDLTVLVVGKGDGRKVVGREGKVVKTISEKLEKEVFVLEESENEEELIRNLAKPARISTINTVYTPEGEKYRVIIPADEKRNTGLSPENFEKLALNLTGKNYSLKRE